MEGVIRTRVGYAGGTLESPTYHNLGDHTESIQVDYDPEVVSYNQLLDVFWENHNPFSQSFSRQYAAILFFHGSEQEKQARDSAARLEEENGRKVQTKISRYSEFFMAEDYHQKYALRGDRVILGEFVQIYPDEVDLVASTAAARVNGYLGGNGNADQLKRELPLLGLSPETQKRLIRLLPSIGSN